MPNDFDPDAFLADESFDPDSFLAGAPQPTPGDLYAQEQEAIDNQPYLSPESMAATEASLTKLRAQPPQRPAPVQAPQRPQATPPSWTDRLTQVGSLVNPVAGVGVTIADAATPYVKEAADFYQRNVGAPLVEATTKFDPVSMATQGTSLEALRRQALAPIAGEEWANRTTSPQADAALRGHVASLPGVGGPGKFSPSVDTAIGGVKGIAQGVIPGIATGAVSGTVGAASKLGPFLSRLVGVAAEGAVGGTLDGLLIQSQDPKTSAVMGAVAGPVLDLGMQGAAKVGKKILNPLPDAPPKTVGVITPEAKSQVMDEAAAMFDEPKTTVDEAGVDMALRTPGVKPGRAPDAPLPHEVAAAEAATSTVKASDIQKPFAVKVRVKDGEPVLTVLEVKRGQPPRVAEMPLTTHTDRSKAFSYMWKTGKEIADFDQDALRSPKVEQFFDELKIYMDERHLAKNPIDRKPITELDEFFAKKQSGGAGQDHIEYDPKIDRYVVRPPNPDVPSAPVKDHKPSVIQEHSDGSLTTKSSSRDDVPTNPGRTPIPASSGGGSPPPPRTPGNLGPPPPPRPPPPPGPGDIDPPQLDEVASVLKAAEKFSAQPSLFERAMRQLVGAHLRGPKDAGNLIAMARGQQALEASAADIHNLFRKLVPKKDWNSLGREVLKYAQGAQNAHVLEHKYPQVWGRIKAEVDLFTQERDLNHKLITELGGVPDDIADLIENGVLDKYMARQYLSHLMEPGEWAKHVRKYKPELLETAAKHFLSDKTFKDWSHDSIAAELTRILKAQDPLDAFRGSPLARGKSSQRLLKRGDIPEPVRVLMGEVENGFFRLAQSVGAQRAIVSNLRMWREIAQSPQMFSRTPTPGLHHPVPLPDSKRHFGDAAGGYVTPHLYDALVNVPAAIESGPRILSALVKWGKFNEVVAGGMGPWLNATVGNLWYSMLAGGLDITRPLQSAKAFRTARAALKSYSKTAKNDLILEARRYGADAPGVAGHEIAGNSMADDLLGDTIPDAHNLIDILESYGRGMVKGVKKGKDWLSVQYDKIDRTFKLANYVAVRDRLIEKGVDAETARRTAARRVNQSFTSPDKMGPAIQKFVKGPAGLVARYGTFFAEDLRINLSLPQRLMEEPDLRARLLGWGIFGSALFGAQGFARTHLGGISEEEVEKVEAAMSDGKKYYRPLTWVLPWRDSRGRPQVFDLTQYFPMARLLQGHPDDAMYRRVLANLILSPVDGGAGEGPMQEFLARTGLIKGQQRRDFLKHEPEVLQTMQSLWDLGIAPKGPERIYEALRQGEAFGPTGPSTEPFTPEQAAMRASGLPMLGGVSPTPTGPSAIGSAFEFKAQLSQLETELRRAAGMDPNQAPRFLMALYQTVSGETPSQMKEAKIQRIKQAIQALAAKQSQRNTTLGGQP